MVFRGYNKVDSHEDEKEDNPYCPICKLRKEEDLIHLYRECEALADLRNLERAKGLIGAPITAYIKEYIDSIDNNKRVHKAWCFMRLLQEELAQKIAELATESNFEISELLKILTKCLFSAAKNYTNNT